MRFFCLLAFVALAVCQNSPPVAGTASVIIDLTGLSPDVSVSFSTDLANVYRNQGGAVQNYTVPTTNSLQNVQVVITEGGVATVTQARILSNGATWVVTGHRAALRIHLENYDVPAGNSYNVKLRVTLQGQAQVFREYNDNPSPPAASTVPLSWLGAPIPSSTYYTVAVLNTAAPVTVYAGEFHGATLAVYVIGHNGNNLFVDSNCQDLVCDSGRLVARATYQQECTGADYQLPVATNTTLLSNPAPSVYPVQVVRVRYGVPPGTFYDYVLAVDNYQYVVAIGDVHTVNALNCLIGECEAAPITSVLSVFSSSLRGSLQISVDGVPFSLPYAIRGDTTRICVLNLPLTEVTASFTTGGVVRQTGINCGDVDQTCQTYIYGVLTPNYSCLPSSNLSVAVVVRDSAGVIVYNNFGPAEATLVVPALNGLTLSIYDGVSSWSPSGFYDPAVIGNENVTLAVTDCSAFQDTSSAHQSASAPGACQVLDRADRMLSIFDLAFLPELEPGFAGNGQLPINGPNSSVAVTLQLPGGQVFRVVYNQGGAPRMYCVLPVKLEAKITENCACFTSDLIDCTVSNPVPGTADCSLCDFLSILQYNLTGLPREVNSIISAGPSAPTTTNIVFEKFESFGSGACTRIVNGSTVGFLNYFPQQSAIELWGQGCNGAPRNFPDGTPTGNTIKVGRIAGKRDARMPPPLVVSTTCTTFTTPLYSNAINVGFYAWQHGSSGSPNQQDYVTAIGNVSGSSLKAWVTFTPGAWNWNFVQLLDTAPGESVSVCWVQNGVYAFNIDNVTITADVFPLCPIRNMYWQGNFFNQIVVLRAGGGQGCPYGQFQRYCIRVFDGTASKEQCTVCNDKTCQPENPFACSLCLDLASPNDSPGLENSIQLSISYNGGNVRTITGQGGTNGCILSKRDVNEVRNAFAEMEQRLTEARGLTSAVLQQLERDEVEKQRREILQQVKEEYVKNHRLARSGPYVDPGQMQSVYTLLCLRYKVCVSENCMGPLCFDVDCTVYGNCSYTDIIADASIDLGECPSLPANLNLTIYNDAATFSRAGVLLTGCQVRGPQGQMILNQSTCTWSAPQYIGPSYGNIGSGVFSFPVLRLPFQIRLDENTLAYTGTPFPELFQHPWSSAVLDCTGSATCAIPIGRLVALWNVTSERGLPDNGLFQIKFGDNSQNVIRAIPSSFLSAPEPNYFCVLADKRPYYVAQWGSWSSRGPFLPFDDCSDANPGSGGPLYCLTSVVVPPISK